jgi:single-stranded DNA-specific DHH superfamily exonuclease
LAGVGVAFKLAQALFKTTSPQPPARLRNDEVVAGGSPSKGEGAGQYEAFEKWLLDLVAIGTVGDMSPILGENRTLV